MPWSLTPTLGHYALESNYPDHAAAAVQQANGHLLVMIMITLHHCVNGPTGLFAARAVLWKYFWFTVTWDCIQDSSRQPVVNSTLTFLSTLY